MILTEEMIRKLPLMEEEEYDGEQLGEEAADMFEDKLRKYMEENGINPDDYK